MEHAEEFFHRIPFPVVNTPHCRLEIEGRCLFALNGPYYPYKALSAKASGKITLSGRVSPSGSIIDVHVDRAEVGSGEAGKLLSGAALDNFSHWQLEPAPKEMPIKVTYVYRIEPSLTHGTTADVQFELPKQVTIQGNP